MKLYEISGGEEHPKEVKDWLESNIWLTQPATYDMWHVKNGEIYIWNQFAFQTSANKGGMGSDAPLPIAELEGFHQLTLGAEVTRKGVPKKFSRYTHVILKCEWQHDLKGISKIISGQIDQLTLQTELLATGLLELAVLNFGHTRGSTIPPIYGEGSTAPQSQKMIEAAWMLKMINDHLREYGCNNKVLELRKKLMDAGYASWL